MKRRNAATGGVPSEPEDLRLRVRIFKSALLNLFVWAISLSYAFLDWSIYRENFRAHPDGWKLYFSGGIEAPWQYRIGVWEAVRWMNQWFHLKPYDTLTLIDLLCLALSLWAILRVLRNSEGHRVPVPIRWLATAGVLCLAEYYLMWGHWFQAEETIPSILFVALSVALVYGEIVRSRALACLLLVCLGGIQGFIRADVAVVLHAGFFLAVLSSKRAVPLGRTRQAVTSLLTAFVAGCVQLYLMLVRFPNARYGASGPVRVASNLSPEMWLTMLLATLPFWLLLGLIVAKKYRPDAVTTMLLVSSLLYLPLWATVGLLDEVRIFLPFAFALMPATVLALMGRMPEASIEN
jgi:hypothetical protein